MKQKLTRNNKIRELHDKGMSYAEIGRIYGISRERVRQLCQPYAMMQRNISYMKIKHLL